MAKNNTPVSYNTHNTDTMHLIHESVHKYVTVLRHYPWGEGSGLAIQLAPLVIINEAPRGVQFQLPNLDRQMARRGYGD